MTPQTLRESIFLRAFEGKLVAQRPHEGTAEDTLKGTKIKAVQTVEERVDIPETWRWTYLVDLAEILYGFPFNSEKFNESHIGMPIIRIRDINNGYSNTYSDEPCDERYRIVAGDMLVGMDGNFQVAFWTSEDAWLNQRVCKIASNSTVLIQKYLYYYLPIILKEINGTVSYSTVKHLSARILNQMLIPLPPLAEQKRIVAKIEELLPLIDRYEQAWSALEAFNARFPVDMQKSILQMAIQGKLVPQLPEDGSASVLLELINCERQHRIRAKTAKENKKVEPITEDDIPFDIPDSWEWIRFGDLVSYHMGKTPPRAESQWWGNDIPWVSIADMPKNGHIIQTKERVSSSAVSEKFAGKISKAGTLLMSFKLTVGKVSILDIDAVHNEAIISIYPYADHEKTIQNYLFLLLPYISQYGESKNAIKGKTLNDTSISNLLIPLPPLAEQKRIVAKLEEILPLCERLK